MSFRILRYTLTLALFTVTRLLCEESPLNEPLPEDTFETSRLIADCIDPASGAFIQEDQDIFVDCPVPLAFVRRYSSLSNDEGTFGIGYTDSLNTRIDVLGNKRVALGLPGGTAVHMARDKEAYYLNPQLMAVGLTNLKSGYAANTHRLKTTRLEQKPTGEWVATDHTGVELRYDSSGRITEDLLFDGNCVIYTYDAEDRLVKVSATDKDRSVVYGWISIRYLNTEETEVTGSNGEVVVYRFSVDGKKGRRLIGVRGSHLYPQDLSYCKSGKISTVERGGRVERCVQYSRASNIYALSATKVSDGLGHQYKIEYFRDREGLRIAKTRVTDSEGGVRIYRYNKNSWLTSVAQLVNGQVYSETRFFYGNVSLSKLKKGVLSTQDTGQLKTRATVDASGKILSCQTYTYDSYGNVISETIVGNLSGHSSAEIYLDKESLPVLDNVEHITRCFSYSQDGQFLLVDTDATGVESHYEYVLGTSLTAKIIKIARGVRLSETSYSYNYMGVLTNEETIDILSGCHQIVRYTILENPDKPGFGKPQFIERLYVERATSAERSLGKTEYRYDKKGRIVEELTYDADHEFYSTIKRRFSARGELLSETDPAGSKTSYEYDDFGNKTKETIRNGSLVRQFKYDERNRIIELTESDGSGNRQTETYRYDSQDRRTGQIDRLGNVTEMVYDPLGRLIGTTLPDIQGQDGNPLHMVNRYVYDTDGNVVEVHYPDGSKIGKSYNCRRQNTVVKYSDGSLESRRYSLTGLHVETTLRDGSVERIGYDRLGRQCMQEHFDPRGRSLSWKKRTYFGDILISIESSSGVITTFEYDDAGRKVLERIDGEGGAKINRYSYDALGRQSGHFQQLSATSDDGIDHYFEHDSLNRVVAQRSYWNRRLIRASVSGYDTCGNQILQASQRDESTWEETTTEYDAWQRVVSITNPAGESHYVQYKVTTNPLGQSVDQVIQINHSGSKSVKTMDTQGRIALLESFSPTGSLIESVETVYDLAGNKQIERHQILKGDGGSTSYYRIKWSRDSNGRVTAVTHGKKGSFRTQRYTYDSIGRVLTNTLSSGVILTYQYNIAGQLQQVRSSDGTIHYQLLYDRHGRLIEETNLLNDQKVCKQYDGYGRLVEETYPHGEVVTLEHDALDRITGIVLPDTSRILYRYAGLDIASAERQDKSGSTSYIYEVLERDLVGRLTVASLPGQSGDLRANWDSRGRLSDFIHPEFSQTLNYDKYGNVCSQTIWEGSRPTQSDYRYDSLNQLTAEQGSHSHTYSYDSINNRLKKDKVSETPGRFNELDSSGYIYDANGNLQIEQASIGNSNYAWDALGRLTRVECPDGTSVYYTYDLAGRRLTRATERKESEHYFFAGELELGASPSKNRVTQLKVPAVPTIYGAPVAIEINSTAYGVLCDHLTSVRSLLRLSDGTPVATYRYSAFGETETIGNSIDNPWKFCGKRQDPSTSLYTIGKRDYQPAIGRWISPDPAGFEDGPNLYAYAKNNPVGRFDPTGLSSEPALGVGDDYALLIRNSPRHTTWTYNYDRLWNRPGPPTPYYHAGSFKIGTIQHSEAVFGFTNGMYNTPSAAASSAKYISDQIGGYQLQFEYNPTNSLVADGFRCAIEYAFGYPSETAVSIAKKWTEFHNTAPLWALYLQWCHSEGAINVCNALRLVSREVAMRVYVVAIAPGRLVPENSCYYAMNYVSTSDPIPQLGAPFSYFFAASGASPLRHKESLSILYPKNVVPLDPSPGSDRFDHSLVSRTYQGVFRKEMRNFQDEIDQRKQLY